MRACLQGATLSPCEAAGEEASQCEGLTDGQKWRWHVDKYCTLVALLASLPCLACRGSPRCAPLLHPSWAAPALLPLYHAPSVMASPLLVPFCIRSIPPPSPLWSCWGRWNFWWPAYRWCWGGQGGGVVWPGGRNFAAARWVCRSDRRIDDSRAPGLGHYCYPVMLSTTTASCPATWHKHIPKHCHPSPPRHPFSILANWHAVREDTQTVKTSGATRFF